MTTILLGTVALEPNRWGNVDPSWGPTIAASEWFPRVAAAGFDGVELWERHLTAVPDAEVDRLTGSELPIAVFNSYAGFDEEEHDLRDEAARWIERVGAAGVKYNVGNDPDLETAYAERIARWVEQTADDVRLLCECHAGISIAERPAVAARIFEAAGSASRVQAIVHSGEEPDDIRARFDAYGDRIGHIHVNHLGHPGGPPRLAEIRPELETTVELLGELGFDGTWTIEFVHGTGTEDDNADYLFERAVEDLAVLQELLD